MHDDSSGAPAGDAPAPALVLGLGNPGDRYRGTRHNVGFEVVDELARRRGVRLRGLECNSLVGEDGALLLAQPMTYMNRSGYAARCLVERRRLEPARVLVVFDEVHLPLGRLRLRASGSPGGHRGMESVIENLRTTSIPRLRLGVGPEDAEVGGEELYDFVLEPFAADERERAAAMIERAADACECWLAEGAQAAMNRFNG
jgi:PTH1 family peptidyl-tRNA hydrolase